MAVLDSWAQTSETTSTVTITCYYCHHKNILRKRFFFFLKAKDKEYILCRNCGRPLPLSS
ncbi:MAG: hypothetical protein ACFFCO_00275 [Promethearchaeota archaeon]